ncbi:hypothetical protein FRB96_004227 [Tulasnella sp. 330]|nr:hypothetical protein FRB96_004227 [Tulasnella sp. 330]
MFSSARIKALNQYGQVLGYVALAYAGADWFTFQPLESAVVFDVPVRRDRVKGDEAIFRLSFKNPAEVASNFPFLGIHFRKNVADQEEWMLCACDEGQYGAIYQERAKMYLTNPPAGVGYPASSRVWSIHTVEGGYEELRLNWLDITGGGLHLRLLGFSGPIPLTRPLTEVRKHLKSTSLMEPTVSAPVETGNASN